MNMKNSNKLKLFFCIFGLLAGPTYGKAISFGIESGLNLSNIDKQIVLSSDAKSLGFQTTGFTAVTGFDGCLFGELEIVLNLSL